MALNLLSVPAQSSETERLFSSAKLTLTPQRLRMEAEVLEVIECLKSWTSSLLLQQLSLSLSLLRIIANESTRFRCRYIYGRRRSRH